jgi:hypothetical protein
LESLRTVIDDPSPDEDIALTEQLMLTNTPIMRGVLECRFYPSFCLCCAKVRRGCRHDTEKEINNIRTVLSLDRYRGSTAQSRNLSALKKDLDLLEEAQIKDWFEFVSIHNRDPLINKANKLSGIVIINTCQGYFLYATNAARKLMRRWIKRSANRSVRIEILLAREELEHLWFRFKAYRIVCHRKDGFTREKCTEDFRESLSEALRDFKKKKSGGKKGVV